MAIVRFRKQIATTSGGQASLVRENLAGGRDAPVLQAPTGRRYKCVKCGKKHTSKPGAQRCASSHFI